MNKKRFTAIVILLLIILVILIIAVIYLRSTSENIVIEEEEIVYTEEILNSQEISRVENNNLFYTLESCIQKYETILYLDYTEQLDEYNMPTIASAYGISDREGKIEAIISLLDADYISENGINSTNLFDYLPEDTGEITVEAVKMNKLIDDNADVEAYTVEANLIDENDNSITEFFVLKIDNKNTTFAVTPINTSEYSDLDEIEFINTTKEIEPNGRNTYVEIEYNDGQIATKYFQEYKTLLLTNPSEAYLKLDEEYRSAKFSSEADFEEYINKNEEKIEGTQIMQYQAEQREEYNRYVCLTIDNTYWIIVETAPREYTVILDSYTIDLPEFTEQYEEADDANKVLLNIQKVFAAINDGDYNYVYNKLDDTFKQNNFPTLEEFETYMQENFYENNDIAYSNYQTNTGLHIYEISITNADDDTSGTITKNFIMQLLDGTDFVMSFSV